jgi:hypothetical protein
MQRRIYIAGGIQVVHTSTVRLGSCSITEVMLHEPGSTGYPRVLTTGLGRASGQGEETG